MLRLFGCDLIQQATILLKLPQVTGATAQTYFHRFYARASFAKYDVQATSRACLFLATKNEETQRRSREVINVFHHLEQRRLGLPYEPLDYDDMPYHEAQVSLFNTERYILRTLGFDMRTEHPHRFILNFLPYLGLEGHAQLIQLAWNYLNDSLRTTLALEVRAEAIATSAIYMAVRKLSIPLPDGWWELFDTSRAELEHCVRELTALYHAGSPQYIPVKTVALMAQGLTLPSPSPGPPTAPSPAPPAATSPAVTTGTISTAAAGTLAPAQAAGPSASTPPLPPMPSPFAPVKPPPGEPPQGDASLPPVPPASDPHLPTTSPPSPRADNTASASVAIGSSPPSATAPIAVAVTAADEPSPAEMFVMPLERPLSTAPLPDSGAGFAQASEPAGGTPLPAATATPQAASATPGAQISGEGYVPAVPTVTTAEGAVATPPQPPPPPPPLPTLPEKHHRSTRHHGRHSSSSSSSTSSHSRSRSRSSPRSSARRPGSRRHHHGSSRSTSRSRSHDSSAAVAAAATSGFHPPPLAPPPSQRSRVYGTSSTISSSGGGDYYSYGNSQRHEREGSYEGHHRHREHHRAHSRDHSHERSSGYRESEGGAERHHHARASASRRYSPGRSR